ncbi:MAG: hypothetical protein ACREPF_02850 [Rhodanobacteraceae bacterium]
MSSVALGGVLMRQVPDGLQGARTPQTTRNFILGDPSRQKSRWVTDKRKPACAAIAHPAKSVESSKAFGYFGR